MQPKPSIDLGEWQEANSRDWEVHPHCFVSNIDVVSACNEYIQRHGSLIETPVRLVASYRSYLIQVLKDVDCLIGCLKRGEYSVSDHTDYVIDVSLAKAQPWRFTAYVLSFMSAQLRQGDVTALDETSLWAYISPLLDDAFDNGALFRLEKYIKAGHVLMDISYDIGWDALYAKASHLKAVDGFEANPERAATLRELALYAARSFWRRDYLQASKKVLCIGFSDISTVIAGLDDTEIENLLLGMNSKQAVHTLFCDEIAQSTKNVSCNQIAEGALRVIGGDRVG